MSGAEAADERAGGAMAAVWRNLSWLLASRGVLAVLSLIYLGIVTRALGVYGFGRFALITGAAQTLTTLVAFQSWQVIVQYGTGPLAAGDRPALARLFRGSALVDLAGALVGFVLAWIILAVWGEALGIGETLKRATLIFVAVQLVCVRSTPIGMLRLSDRFAAAAAADSVTPVARFIGAILIWLIHPTVQGFLVAWGAAEILTALAFWVVVARSGELALMKEGRGVRGLPAEHPGIVRFALSTNASSTLGLSSKQLPLLIVGGAAGPAAAGIFRLAIQLAQALGKLSQLISRAAFPEVVKTLRHATPGEIGRILNRLYIASGAAAIVIMLVVAVAGRPVLELIGGRDFSAGWIILLWLALAGCLDFATVGVDTILTALQRAGTVFAIRAVGAGTMIAAALALLPLMGPVGVAVAVAIGSACVAALMAVVAVGLSRG